MKPGRIREQDIIRTLRAAKKMGIPFVRIEVGEATLVLPLDQAHIALMSDGHLPSPDPSDEREKYNLHW